MIKDQIAKTIIMHHTKQQQKIGRISLIQITLNIKVIQMSINHWLTPN